MLIVITLVSGWLLKLTDLNEQSPVNTHQHSPDYLIQNYSKSQMNALGQLSEQLIATSLSHYNDDGRTELEQPMLLSFTNPPAPSGQDAQKSAPARKAEQPTPWFIKADAGLLLADGVQLKLQGKVLVNRINTHNSRPLTINTRQLEIFLDKKSAQTSQWAELISQPQRTTGIGMSLSYASPVKVSLFKQVKGHYETH